MFGQLGYIEVDFAIGGIELVVVIVLMEVDGSTLRLISSTALASGTYRRFSRLALLQLVQLIL